MDSTEFNKIAGGLIGAFLLLLLLNFAAGKIYGTAETHGHDEPLAFALDVESADEATAEAEPEAIDYGALVASADVAEGEKIFKKCQSCHKVEAGANGVGPTLYGVVGRKIGTEAGFGYSGAMAEHGGEWNLAELGDFLADPKGYVPGTKMAFAGIKDPQDRVSLIAYLNQADGTPIDLAATAPAVEKPADEGAGHGEEKPADEGAKDEAPKEESAAPAEEKAAEKPAEDAAKEETAAPAEDKTAEEKAAEEKAAEEKAADEKTEVAVADKPAEATSSESSGAVVSAAFAGGDAAEGEKVFRKCKACHKVEEGKNGVGPNLWGIIGRDVASVDGFSYSPALQGIEGEWTASKLSAFLTDPKAFAPGTKMALSGLKKEEDRVNLITYLNEADGTPDALQ